MHPMSQRTTCRRIAVICLAFAGAAFGQNPETVRVPVTRDAWFSNVGDEANCNTGGSNRLKLKSIQEMFLLDIEPGPLRGRVILSATLHLRVSGNEIARRVTVSSFAAPWVEGTSPSYQAQAGSSTHNARQYPDVPWASPASDMTAVMLGQGGTIWRMADASPPDQQGWQRIPVDPRIVAARVAGVSHGMLVFDDTGTEWTRNGEQFNSRHFPNRFFHSRESGQGSAPFFTVSLGPADGDPPAAPGEIAVDTSDLPAGEAEILWTTPRDEGPAGTIGFLVSLDGKLVPRYLIPAAGDPEQQVKMRLRDLDLRSGQEVKLSVRAVDGAGNIGAAVTETFRVSDFDREPLPGTFPESLGEAAPLPTLAGAKVTVIDALDKVHPATGKMIPEQPAEYASANHLFRAKDRQVRLAAARNEFVAFQVLLDGQVHNVRPSLVFEEDDQGFEVTWGRYRYVNSNAGPLPDPVVPLKNPVSVPHSDNRIAGQTRASLLCEVYVPHAARTGAHRGTLTLEADGGTLKLNVIVRVWDFTLPDFLSFLSEMNCYSLPENEGDYYRLAHVHRTLLNRLPYSQNGRVDDGCAPEWRDGQLDWSKWERRFGAYLSGAAFDDLPRKGVPLEVFYLPLHENWPSPIDPDYNGDYWADRAFRPGYREAFTEASRQIAAHVERQGWHDTLFHCYFNNKVNFKSRGWSRGSSPWLLDEPANFQDYWALRYFGEAFHEGVAAARGNTGEKAKLLYRCDISRPQWQRDSLDHVLDYNVVNGRVLRRYTRIVLDRKRDFGQIVVDYGTTNAIHESNMQAVGWCLDSWTLGSDGVLPWQTIGRHESWEQADQLSLFYPGSYLGQREPIPSVRLKAYRRGEQDVEYLTLLAKVLGQPRWAVGQSVREALNLKAEHRGTGVAGGEDAGEVHYASLRPQDVWALRVRVARVISEAAPRPVRRLVDLRTPRRDAANAPPAYVEEFAPNSPAAMSETPGQEGTGSVIILQGRDAVRDTIVDPESPDQNFGSVPRDNRLKRRDECSAFLVHFDLDKLDMPQDARVVEATVSFHVWDPSGKGNAKVHAFGLTTPWDESEATWQRPSAGETWRGGRTFRFGVDTATPSPHIIVPPNAERDVVDPPIEYRLDVADLVRAWLSGKTPNYGLAIAPQIDRSIDDGQHYRFQVLASEYQEKRYTPKLTVTFR